MKVAFHAHYATVPHYMSNSIGKTINSLIVPFASVKTYFEGFICNKNPFHINISKRSDEDLNN